MRRTRSDRRGFALFSVMLLTIVLVLMGSAVLEVVQVDILLSRGEREKEEAREVAEGAVLEVVEDATTPDLYPALSDPKLRATYPAAASSPFASGRGRRSYTAAIELVRVVPLSESSIVHTRGIVYEVSATGDILDGDSRFTAASEIVRSIAVRPGLIMPRRHAR